MQQPPELTPDKAITLNVGQLVIGYGNIKTRAYNGMVPGPTFRCKPGDTFDVTVVNNLLEENNVDCETTGERFCNSATTSFHFHGFHVSARGPLEGLEIPSDDVEVEIPPGASQRYVVKVPEYHMSGTFWYHPHTHHATLIQAAGGLLGMIVMDDPEGYLPWVYSSMEEKIVVMTALNFQILQNTAVKGQSGLLETAKDGLIAAGLEWNTMFVNGAPPPTISLESGKWYRFRMLFAAIIQDLFMSLDGGASCDMKLLAKDGIYLTDMPRDIKHLNFVSGTRADVAFSCTCTSYPCETTLRSQAGRTDADRMDYKGKVFTLKVSQGSGTAPELPATTVQRPCYLVDLRGVDVKASGDLHLDGDTRTFYWNGEGLGMTPENFKAAGGWAGWKPMTTFEVGAVYEMKAKGVNQHPLHSHVNPFQITSMPQDSYYDNWYKVGDWHDTLMIGGALGDDGVVTVRQQTDAFTGKEVFHCHILSHEDEGRGSS